MSDCSIPKRSSPASKRDGSAPIQALREMITPHRCPEREPNQSMAQEGEANQSMAQASTPPKPDPESMHMEGEFRLAMTRESIHALGVRVPNLD